MRRRSMPLAALALVLVAPVACSKPKPPDPVALVEKLKSPDETVSGAASLELIRLGEPGVAALVELLRDPEPRHRALAARTFWGMGARGGAAAAALGEALADADTVGARRGRHGPRQHGARGRPGGGRARSEPCAIPAPRSGPGRLNALGSVGSAAESAVPALERAARLDGVHGPAEEAIRKIRAR